jgi:hypothetical protein
VGFFDADGLAGEDRAEIDFFVPQTDAAAVGNHTWIVYQAIFWRDSHIAIVDRQSSANKFRSTAAAIRKNFSCF